MAHPQQPDDPRPPTQNRYATFRLWLVLLALLVAFAAVGAAVSPWFRAEFFQALPLP